MPLTAMNTSRTWQNMYLKTWNTARTGNRAFTTNSLAMQANLELIESNAV